jgi:hypothetical protein
VTNQTKSKPILEVQATSKSHKQPKTQYEANPPPPQALLIPPLNKMSPKPSSLALPPSTVHVLPPGTIIPQAYLDLLTLGLNYIPTKKEFSKNELNCISNSYRPLTLAHYFKNDINNANPNPPKKIPSGSTWNPEDHPDHQIIKEFISAITPKPSHQPHQSWHHTNLTTTQHRTLRKMMKDTRYVIKPADKNVGATIMEKNWYITTCLKQLTPPTYRHIKHTNEIIAKFKRILTTLNILLWNTQLNPSHIGHLNKLVPNFETAILNHIKHLQSMNQRYQDTKDAKEILNTVCAFYGLPKVHKSPVDIRPIAANLTWSTALPSKLLVELLSPYVISTAMYTPDSTTALHEFKQLRIPISSHGKIHFIAADVKSLYPSIPIQQAIKMIIEYLRPKTNPITLIWIDKLLQLVLFNNIIVFNNEYYLQTQGTAMGTPCAPQFATLFLAILEQTWYDKWKSTFLIAKRYIDDIGIITTATSSECEQMITEYNGLCTPHITITHTTSSSNMTFLDLDIRSPTDYELSTIATGRNTFPVIVSCHQKAINRFQYIHYNSDHPRHVLRSYIRAEIERYRKINTDDTTFRALRYEFWNRLIRRGYPPVFLNPIFKNSMLPIHIRKEKDTNNQSFRFIIPRNNYSTSKEFRTKLNKEYQIMSERIHLKKTNCTITYSLPPTLKDKLVRAKL